MNYWIDSTFFSFLFPILLLLFVGIGYYAARKYKKTGVWESSGVENAVIGIFALLISFTFLNSGNAFRDRNSLIHQEADAIMKMSRYASTLDDSTNKLTRDFIKEFLLNQIDKHRETYQTNDSLMHKGREISTDFWISLQARRSNLEVSQQANFANLCSAFDQLQSCFARLAFSFDERTPPLIIYVLIIASLLIGVLIGFMNAIKSRVHYLVPAIYVILICLMMQTIRDLDNPYKGVILNNYSDIEDVYKRF